MKIRIKKSFNKMVGSLRVSQDLFAKIEKLGIKNKVSNQEVVRAILEQVIDEVEL